MSKYKHLFFDLDRTLWDFESNSKEAIKELFAHHSLQTKLGCDYQSFYEKYAEVNHNMWDLYRANEITKDELRLRRYYDTLNYFQYEDKAFALELNDEYISRCSGKPNLIDGSIEVLEYLSNSYTLHIITNGFIEAQEVKLENSGIRKYFTTVVISDGLGFKKPDSRIFYHALNLANTEASDSLMIGDDYGPDIEGAKSVGMDQCYFKTEHSSHEPATYCITHLLDLKNLL